MQRNYSSAVAAVCCAHSARRCGGDRGATLRECVPIPHFLFAVLIVTVGNDHSSNNYDAIGICRDSTRSGNSPRIAVQTPRAAIRYYIRSDIPR
eukprot:gene9450-biopygen2826